MISNEELKQCVPLMGPGGWWDSKTDKEKEWYLKLWRSCR